VLITKSPAISAREPFCLLAVFFLLGLFPCLTFCLFLFKSIMSNGEFGTHTMIDPFH